MINGLSLESKWDVGCVLNLASGVGELSVCGFRWRVRDRLGISWIDG